MKIRPKENQNLFINLKVELRLQIQGIGSNPSCKNRFLPLRSYLFMLILKPLEVLKETTLQLHTIVQLYQIQSLAVRVIKEKGQFKCEIFLSLQMKNPSFYL